MRAVLQRAASGRVTSDGAVLGEIGRGLVVLLGVAEGDSDRAAEWIAGKTVDLRVFEDQGGRMNLSVADVGGEVLLVSQFTLLADCRKGRRPSFVGAATPEEGERLYDLVRRLIEARGVPVATGRFGAKMLVEIANDGPVTIVLDSPGGPTGGGGDG